MKLSRLLLPLLLAVSVALAACGGESTTATPAATSTSTSAATSTPMATATPTATATPSPTPSPSPTPAPASPTGEVIVFAASSLTEAFGQIKAAYEAKYPGTTVTFNFGGTPTLRTQLEQGARADVFASANQEQMQLAITSGVVQGSPSTFATNRLVVITPDGNTQVRTLADLAASGTKLVIALPDVPVGGYARQAFQKLSGTNGLPSNFEAAALANVVSEESNVRQVVSKVYLDEADAGVVYQTDVTPDVRDGLTVIEIPDAANVVASYPLAQADDTPNPLGGQTFVEFVMSEEGQAILRAAGFGAP